MISEASRYATKYTKTTFKEVGITKGLGLYIIAGEKEYRADLDALLTLLCKKVKLSDLENIPIKWGYPRLTYDQTLKILERK